MTEPAGTSAFEVGLSFGVMLDRLRAAAGRRATRSAWRGRYYLVRVPGSRFTVDGDRPLGQALPWMAGRTVRYLPHLDRFDRVDHSVRTWTPGSDDLEADDWIVEASTSVPASSPG